jgi:hypothetical protein
MGRSLRFLPAAAAAAAFVVLPSLPANAASCGGLLQPPCPQPALYAPAPDPGGTTDANLSVPPPAGKVFGFNTNLWSQTSRDWVPFEVSRSAQAGAQIIRTTVTWATLASSPSKPLGDEAVYPRGSVSDASTLKQLDELYDRATAAGLQLDLIINNAPRWATAYASCTPVLGVYSQRCAPVAQGKRLYPTSAHLVDLSNFVTALGQRYPGVIFETWNEPNIDQGPQAVGGGFIGQMQCAVWQAAKALTPPSQVLSAAFGDFYGVDATRSYMRAFYSTGLGCFDDLSVHTYNGSAHSFGANSPLAGHMQIYRDARTEAGDTTPIWITEFGFTTSHDSHTVSEADQDTLTWQEYNKLLTMPDVQTAIVHTLRDDSQSGYGWVRTNGTLKPIYCDSSARAGHPAC